MSSLDRHIAGCLYCGRLGPYSDEHVVSAGLGGDDPAWMLRGCVCSSCNTSTFSKLEAHVLKASPIALARLFKQPTTRDGQPPSPLQARTTLQITDGGPQLAGELAARGQPRLFAQVVFEKGGRGGISDQLALTGPDLAAIQRLFVALRDLLADELSLIEKHTADAFTATPITWQCGTYHANAPMQTRKPPSSCVWFEPVRTPGTTGRIEALSVFQRSSGQVVGRSSDIAHLCTMLSLLRSNLDSLAAALDQPVASATVVPRMNLQVKAELDAIHRTMVKIGLNLTAHLFSPGVLRRAEFDAAVAYAMIGGTAPPRAQLPSELLGPAIAERHVFHLSVNTDPHGNPALFFMARLYDGGPIESFVLAQFVAPAAGLESTVVHVDYTTNQFEQMTLEEHLLRAYGLTGGADPALLFQDKS
ncbi:hypothetical protein [Stenotrophomonas oahuensis]|uniref:HNH endonuclease 5 domain-containing protein n=1 Tax=Stenotrophomonas oahuensis TaxID=3003271 RepID=A0ABY9YNR3_9GAMM|nr:hypothetical protein [Stenotrophomonas sp. A5586]WNH52085.1 hypothetical protein PDM29_17350 [Stenotrophomonas sp. A5586]